MGAEFQGIVGKDLDDTNKEMARADILHGGMVNIHEAYGILMEEVDEFFELVKMNPAKMYSVDERRDYAQAMREELIQIAATALRAIKVIPNVYGTKTQSLPPVEQ